MPKCKWLKPALGRATGAIEENEEWLIEKWERDGLVKRLDDDAPSQRFEGEHGPEKSIDAPPVDKAMKPGIVKKK